MYKSTDILEEKEIENHVRRQAEGSGPTLHSSTPFATEFHEHALPFTIAFLSVISMLSVSLLIYMAYRIYERYKTSSSKDEGWQLGWGRKFHSAKTEVERECSDDGTLPASSCTISQSTPDIVQSASGSLTSLAKKVIRQTTLPTVSTRHEKFRRQLSNTLDHNFHVVSSIHSTDINYHQTKLSPVGEVDPALYAPSPPTSVESPHSRGHLYFSLRYSNSDLTLVVRVIGLRQLTSSSSSASSVANPYVKIYLLPDRQHRWQTKVAKRCAPPHFDEIFLLPVSLEELLAPNRTRTLQFSVYDFDRFSRHDLIGHVLVKEFSYDELEMENFYRMDILTVTQEQADLGELMVSLCYLPTAGRLTCTIIKARNLKPTDIVNATSSAYVKASLMCEGKRIKKKKTTVRKGNLSPVYNEALVFDVPPEKMDEISLILYVINYDRLSCNEMIGCCVIGMEYVGPARDHWNGMIAQPRKQRAQWYPLLESLPHRQSSSDE